MFFLTSCNSAAMTASAEKEVMVKLPDEQAINVTIKKASLENFEYRIHLNGKIKSLRDQVIFSENAGRIVSFSVTEGDYAQAGSVLAIFDMNAIKQHMERANLEQYNAQKEYESQLLGYESLLTGKTGQEANAIKQKLKISTGLAVADQTIKELTYELNKSSIRAPFSGIIADVKVLNGQMIKAGDELFRIYDPASLLLEVNVLEADIGYVKKGKGVDIIPIGEASDRYKGYVSEINPYVDESGMVKVRLKITDHSYKKSDNKLFPGMNCDAVINVPSKKALVVPKDALVIRNGKPVIFTYKDGSAKWNDVVTGRDNGEEVEIKSGLAAGEKVIITNNLQLSHGTAVRLGKENL